MATRTAAAGSTTWTAAAFSGGAATVAGDEVVVPTGATLTISAANTVLCRSISVTGTGTLVFAATTSIVTVGDATAGTGNVAISVSSGATITRTGIGTINLNSTSATQQTITTNGKVMPNITFGGVGGNYVLGDALTANNITLNASTFDTANLAMTYAQLSIGSGGTRTLTLGSSALTATSVAITYGNFGGCTITPTTAVITCTATPTSFNNIFVLNSFNWQGLSFVLTGGGQASLNIANATIGGLTITGPANQTTQYRVTGNFTCTSFTSNGNSAVNRPLIFGIVNGTANTITAGSSSISNTDFMDITGAGAASWAITSGVVGDWGGNSVVATTTPATQTRDATSGSAWSVAARWTSRVPLPQDDVVINASSGNISATDVQIFGKSINFTGYTGTLTHTSSGSNYTIFGDMILSTGMSFGAAVNTFNLDFRGRGTQVLTSNGKVYFPFSSNGTTTIAAPGGTYTLTDTFSMPSGLSIGNYTLNITAGTFNSANQTINVGRIVNSGSITRSVILGTSTINLMIKTASAMISNVSTGLTYSAASATFNVVNVSANTRTIDLQTAVIGTLNYTNAGSTGQLSSISSGTINTLNFSDATNARILQLTANTVLSVITFNVFGTSGKLMTVKSASTTVAYLNSPLQLYNSSQDYIAYEYVQVNQPQSLWLGANSTATSCVGILASEPTYKHVQSTAAAPVTGTAITATYPAATTPGNLLIAYFTSSNSQGTYTPPSGWTLAKSSTSTVLTYIYYKVADGTETSVAFSQTTSRTLNAAVVEYTGFSGTPTLDVTDSNGTGSSVTSLSTTATTGPTNTDQPALTLAMLANPSTLAATVSLTNSFIEDRTLTNASSAYKGAVKELTTTAAVDTTFTWTTARANTAAALVVFINVGSATSTGNFFLFM